MTGAREPSNLVEDAAERFYAGAADRILRLILAVGVALIVPCWLRFGNAAALGFMLGIALSWLNFHWLSQAIRGLADRVVNAHSRERGGRIVLRFLLRYFLIGVAAYVIFLGWSSALYGLLAGLCLPVAAMMLEAGYEAYVALHRGL